MMRSPAEFLRICLEVASPTALGLHMLERDPVGARLPPDARRNLALRALDDGASVGRQLRECFAGTKPDRIASKLDVWVLQTDESPWAGPLLRHADYRARPPEIRLFRAALEPLDRLLAEQSVSSLIGIESSRPVFIAHELYHHVEATRGSPTITRRYAVTRLRIGTWRLSAPVLALSEIAAGACAQAMLELRYHPAILDFVALWHAAPAVATHRAAMFLRARELLPAAKC